MARRPLLGAHRQRTDSMAFPSVVITACTDGGPCAVGECYRRCAIEQMVDNTAQLAAVVDRARAGSTTHMQILDRVGIDY